MNALPTNGLRLFRLFGIIVSLHWSWALVAAYQIFTGDARYSSRLFNVVEYLILFLIVLMHEFGHALACRSVGGTADSIMLWPLGGVAYVSPPPRPGALLWSIAAGPLVNFVLLFFTIPLMYLQLPDDWHLLTIAVAYINAGLLIFNMLPIYPLDGGQIFQSLLWFFMSRGKSLAIATVVGMIGAAGMLFAAWKLPSYWFGILALFAGSRSWAGWKYGVQLRKLENTPRRAGFACPSCGKPPITGNFWQCGNCNTAFDTFATFGQCPGCAARFNITACGECGTRSPIAQWTLPGTAIQHATQAAGVFSNATINSN